MDEQTAIETVYEGLSGQNSIPIKLRTGVGLDREMLSQVEVALRFLIERWKSRPDVPKRIARIFVDLQGAMKWGGDQYSEKEQNEIEDAGVALIQLAWQLFE